jgi:hypothetical protein
VCLCDPTHVSFGAGNFPRTSYALLHSPTPAQAKHCPSPQPVTAPEGLIGLKSFLSFHPIPRRLAGRVPGLVLVATCVGIRQCVHPAGQGSKRRRQAKCGGSGGGRESSHPVRRGERRCSAGGERGGRGRGVGGMRAAGGGAALATGRQHAQETFRLKAPPPYNCSMHTKFSKTSHRVHHISGCVVLEDPRACCTCARCAVGMRRKDKRMCAHSRKCRALCTENLRGGRARGYQSCSTADHHRTGE